MLTEIQNCVIQHSVFGVQVTITLVFGPLRLTSGKNTRMNESFSLSRAKIIYSVAEIID